MAAAGESVSGRIKREAEEQPEEADVLETIRGTLRDLCATHSMLIQQAQTMTESIRFVDALQQLLAKTHANTTERMAACGTESQMLVNASHLVGCVSPSRTYTSACRWAVTRGHD